MNIFCTFMQIIYELKRAVKYEYIDNYLLNIRSKGRFYFTFEELKNTFNASDQALRRKITRLNADKKIAIIRKDFYVVLSPEQTINGTIPLYLYIDDLMKYLERSYYLGLYSAAVLYGAAHQQPMEYQVIVQSPMRSIIVGSTKINFLCRKQWSEENIEKKQSAAGYFNVSSPELTALDFMSFNGKIGGISRISTILEELIEEIKPAQMYRTALSYPNNSALQRLGYMLDKVFKRDDLAKSLRRALNKRLAQNIVLAISSPKKGNFDRDWKVDVNVEVESDL